jgi:hypothetical protein
MLETWAAIWWCMALTDPICLNLDNRIGNITYINQADCVNANGLSALHYRKKLHVDLGYSCVRINDYSDYQQQRPRRFLDSKTYPDYKGGSNGWL